MRTEPDARPRGTMSAEIATQDVMAPGESPDRWFAVLHGIFGSGRNWASVARRVVRARPEWGAVLVDLREHGESVGFEPPHTLDRAAGTWICWRATGRCERW